MLMAYSARFCYLAAALWAPQTLRMEDNGEQEVTKFWAAYAYKMELIKPINFEVGLEL